MRLFALVSVATLVLNSCKDEGKTETKYVDVPGDTKVVYTTCEGDDASLEICQGKRGDEGAGEDQNTGDSNQGENSGGGGGDDSAGTSLNLQGSLAVQGAGNIALGLTRPSGFMLAADESSHSIFCTTFEDDPVACSAAVSDGKFDANCDGYAGKTFGCFLRKGTKTLTTIEFSGDTSVVAGAGVLSSTITYDETSGLARAQVDEEKSTALSPDAIATALKEQNVSRTTLADVTGTWKVDCVDDPDKGIACNETVVSAVDTSKNYCSYDSYGEVRYKACAVPGTGVDVPEGYCYEPYMDWDSVTMMDISGYRDCSMDYAYCSDPAMSMMPECMSMKAQEPPTAPDLLYLSEYTNDSTDERKIGLWESKAIYDSCVGSSGDDAKPIFGLKVETNTANSFNLFPLNLSTRNSLDASIDKAIEDLAASADTDYQFIAKKIIGMSATRESWKVEQCQNSPYDDINDTATCKFRLEEFETYTWEDWSAGSPRTVTETYPVWWWDESEFTNNTSGKWQTTTPDGLSSETVFCTFDAADGSGLPFCPPYADASGSYTQSYKLDSNGNKQRLMLVCKVTQNYGDGYSYSWLQQNVAPSSTLTGAGGAIDKMAQASGCDAPYSTGALAGVPKVQLEAIRRVVMELSLSKSYEFDKDNLCHGVEPDVGFSFNSCDSMAYGSAGYQLCWETWNFNSLLAMQKDMTSGVYYSKCSNFTDTDQTSCENSSGTWNTMTPDSTINSWDAFFYEACAASDSATQTAYDAWAGDMNNATLVDDLKTKCTDSLTGSDATTNLTNQVSLMKQLAMRWEWMPAKAIACAGPSTASAKLLNGLENSCMADASLNMFCDMNGNCMSSLRCNGSSDGGKCFSDGEFIGRIPGRLGFMNLKLRTGGAFELSETIEDRWTQWSITENKEESCTATRTTVLNSKSVSTAEFSSIMKTKEDMDCEVKETGTCSDNTSMTKSECEANSGTWTETQNTATTAGMNTGGNSAGATNFERAVMQDMLFNLKLRKCANTTCSEY